VSGKNIPNQIERAPVSKGEKIRHEIREFIPVALFFLVSFQLLAFTQSLMLREQGIHVASYIAAAVGALIVAKVILIADYFSFVDRFPHKPLIYNVLWKTGVYFVASILVRYAEHLIHFWRQSGSFVAANRSILVELNLWHVLVVQLWLLVLLFLYCLANELVRALGGRRVFEGYFVDRNRLRHDVEPEYGVPEGLPAIEKS
jgi:hypothetical protein